MVTLTATPPSEPVVPEIANPAVFSAMLTVLSVAIAPTLSARVPDGAPSSSAIVIVRPDTGSTGRPTLSGVVAVTVTVLSGPSASSSIGVRVNVPVPLVRPGGILNVKSSTAE